VIPDPAERPTVPLWPDAARAFGLGRARAFELARRGELPFAVYRLGEAGGCRQRRCGVPFTSTRATLAMRAPPEREERRPDETAPQVPTATIGPAILRDGGDG
jgi:hypothetical protein